MKILGIHGRASNPNNPSSGWYKQAIDIKSQGHSIDIPQLDQREDPTYESWIKDIKKINIDSYDAVITRSHGGGVFARYVKENNLHLKRVIFCCPGRGLTKRENTGKLYDYLEVTEMNLEKNIDEIYIVHSDDDEVVPYSEGIKFQNQIGGELITLSGVGHKLAGPAIEVIRNLALLGKS